MIASAEANSPDVTLAAALLHDTVEDTDTTLDEIEREFGQEVANLVDEVTDPKGITSEVRRQRQVDKGPHYSHGAKLIKLADKISNVREIGEDPPAHWTVERQLEYFAWARRVVSAIGRVNPVLEDRFLETVARSELIVRDQADASDK